MTTLEERWFGKSSGYYASSIRRFGRDITIPGGAVPVKGVLEVQDELDDTLAEVASTHTIQIARADLNPDTYTRPIRISVGDESFVLSAPQIEDDGVWVTWQAERHG